MTHPNGGEQWPATHLLRIRDHPLSGLAVSYKLGQRAWLDGREAARRNRAARNEPFDLKQWHMAALSLGALGLNDLEDELAQL